MNIEHRLRKLERKCNDRHKLVLVKTSRQAKYSDGERTYSPAQVRRLAAQRPVLLVDASIAGVD